MAEEMHQFYEEEDLYTYEEGSTPSLDQASLTGFTGENENDKLVFITKDDLDQRLAAKSRVRIERGWEIEEDGDIASSLLPCLEHCPHSFTGSSRRVF